MDSGFGTRLREARERQQVSLTSIAAETKIKVSLLEGLERDDLSQWPQGIFRRAYVRSYAQAIGLDPNVVLREFLERYPDPADATPDPSEEVPKPQPMAGLRRLIDAAIGVVPARQHIAKRETATPAIARASPAPEPGTPTELALRLDDPRPSDAAVRSSGMDALTVGRVAEIEGSQEPGPPVPPPAGPDLSALATLCTRLARASDSRELSVIVADAARTLDAVGLVVWSCDSRAATLHPWLAHGYPDAVLAQLPNVTRDADNAIAAAFRSAEPRVVKGENGQTGAVVVPVLAARGCVGVLALELREGDEQRDVIHAMAAILAAQLVPLVGPEPLAEAVSA